MKKVLALGTGSLMVGATLTGALALDLTDYPSPFVMDGKYDTSNAFVIGAKAASADTFAALDIVSNLQFESKVCGSGSGSNGGGSVSVSDGTSEQIPLGSAIAGTSSYQLDKGLDDGDVPTLLDSEITFQGSNYDVSEHLQLAQTVTSPTIDTSITSGDDDYETDVVMQVLKNGIKYYYAFDESIRLNTTDTDDSLKIQFLGQQLDVTSIDSASSFTAYVGAQFYLEVGDSVEVDSKTVTLENVGSGGDIVVTVDGVRETISSGNTETVNGIEIANDETFYEDSKDQRSATLIIGQDASESYSDGDAYVGEDEDDPNWVWNVGNLHTESSTTTSDTAEYSGPYFGISNDFTLSSADDNPPHAGECVDLPNNYLSVCFDSLTVADEDYIELETEATTSGEDLSDAISGFESTGAIVISTSGSGSDETLVIDVSTLTATPLSSDPSTETIYLHQNGTAVSGRGQVYVYYEDPDDANNVVYAGRIANVSSIAGAFYVDYDNTKGTDLVADVFTDDNLGSVNITWKPYDSTYLPNYQDNVTMWVDLDTANTSVLGASAGTEEAYELLSGTTAIGTEQQDMRTRYGIIIRNPESNGGNDKVVMEIPNDQVMANVVIKGRSSVVSGSGSGSDCEVAEVNPVTLEDKDVTDPTDYNLIVVGGPCANDIVEKLNFGYTCEGFREAFSEGEAVIKLADNGDKVAVLVAGYTALDTQRAGKVLANYKNYDLKGTEVVVKGTSLSDITVTSAE